MLKSKNSIRKVAMVGLATGMGLTSIMPAAMTVFAKDGIKLVSELSSDYQTSQGIANLGKGDAKILIKANEGQTLVGKKFGVYKLFNAQNSKDGESINYTFNEEYKAALQKVVGKKLSKQADEVTEYEVIDYMNSLNTKPVEGATAEQELEGRYSDYRYFIEELRDTMKEMGLNPVVVEVTDTKEDGNVEIGGLAYGYYLTDEITNTVDTHSASSLIMMNTANPDSEVQIKSDYPSIIKKIKEDDNQTGWNDIADYEIGQTVPYKYETKVPNMNGYHKYYFAFHDKMDKALTFNEESVQVKIVQSDKEYTLQPSDFKILKATEDGCTFKIEIEDLKAIVDREFPDGMNDKMENVYGQKVEVTYNATLNDNARIDTGRPGFENDVRLEFSNNPDKGFDKETGKTPWDTVVCFTYKVNGLKVNDHEKNLQDAKFRLYSNKECTDEVFVKQSEQGYVVINRDSLGGTDHTGGTTSEEAVEMVSNEDGVFTIIGLDQGQYWLKETQAPDGYRQLLDPIEIAVKPTFTEDRDNYVKGDGATDKTLQSLEATAHFKSFYDGLFGEETKQLDTNVEDGSLNITVVNKVTKKLPITGSNATIIMLGAGSIMVLGGLAASKRSKKETEEK